jgi:hypothetical protein
VWFAVAKAVNHAWQGYRQEPEAAPLGSEKLRKSLALGSPREIGPVFSGNQVGVATLVEFLVVAVVGAKNEALFQNLRLWLGD